MVWRIFLLLLLSDFVHAQNVCPIIPAPTSYNAISGKLYLNNEVGVYLGDLPDNIRSFLDTKFNGLYGISITKEVKNPIIEFKSINEDNITDYYSIRIDDNVVIEYTSDNSAFYAVNSLLQLIHEEGEKHYLYKAELTDNPKFRWRGLHLDVSRHFFSKEEVKRYIDLMVLYKFNTLHWHLTDDQGWRIEIKKYPKLTEIGSFRDSTVVGHYGDNPRVYNVEKYGGFYTQEDIREIVSYARDRYVNVVPEIEMPGHSRAALAAYPEYSCTGDTLPVPGLWGVFDDIYCSRPKTIDFMKNILDEVLELFPSRYIHIGGDEAPKTRWEECEDCLRVMKKNNLNNTHELQSYFIGQIDEYLTSKGRQLIGWDEILEGGLSENAAVMSWRGEAGGIEAAKLLHPVVMTPTTYCYFDYYQSSSDNEPLAIGGYLPIQKVYKFNPIPSELNDEQSKFILGGQANLWTEYIRTMDQLEYMTYPRALALAQSVWSENKPAFEVFSKVLMRYQENYLNRHHVSYSKAIHYPDMKMFRESNGLEIRFNGFSEDATYHVEVSDPDEANKYYYQGDHTKGSNESIYIGRINEGSKVNYKIMVNSDVFKDTFMYNLKSTYSLGMPIELLTPPHPKFDNNGSLNLVNGIYGQLPWKGSEWLGFRESIIEMIVDLEGEKNCSQVEIGFLNQPGSWIYLPERLEVFYSNDREVWRKYIDQEVEGTMDAGIGLFESTNEIKAKFVKIVVHAMHEIPQGMDGAGTKPWTFIDEIEIKGKQ